ncbi:hypothetical protein [Nocardia nepalensis]|uniref:hypothetical protein n=1 Tax=Nocardia nepalensis TaxID=3375448 RepID=UPI003B670BC2
MSDAPRASIALPESFWAFDLRVPLGVLGLFDRPVYLVRFGVIPPFPDGDELG